LDLVLDVAKNAHVHSDQDIAAPESKVRVLVVRAQEDWAIARECWKLQSTNSGFLELEIQAMIGKGSIADLLCQISNFNA
jgi:hypothetical protein